MKLGYTRQVLEKYSNIKFHENTSGGIECSMQTDGHDETFAILRPRLGIFGREVNSIL
jgi:hypothetical protein